MLLLTPLSHIPHVQAGDNLLRLVLDGLTAAQITLQAGDVLVLAQKIVSKAEGQLVDLQTVIPSPQAHALAAEVDKDPRLVELILRESTAVSRKARGVLVVRHRLGFVSANAGIDRSNVQQDPAEEQVLLLPTDPDQSAADLRQQLYEATGTAVGIVITDSHGRPFRQGTVGVAIGVAGLPALWDRRGETDLYGYTLRHTTVGTADEIASAASLLMGQAAEATPIVHLRGLHLPPQNGRATDLIRPTDQDLYA